MKKIILMALAAGVLVSCEPLKEEGTFDVNNVNAEQLLNGATFAQYDAVTNEDGTVSYVPSQDGNYIEYAIPSVNAVTIYYLKSDGSQATLDYGKNSGMFYFKPTRGSEPVQQVYFQYLNADLNDVVATKEFTLQVAQELSAGDKILCSNSGSKKWYWNPTNVNSGAVWGNAGYLAGAQTDPQEINGAWWGCGVVDGDCPNTFADQLGHSPNGALIGEEYSGSYMVFNEDGSLTKYSPEGEQIGAGSFKLEGYNGGEQIGDYYVAKLQTSAGAILWPWMINYESNNNPNKQQEPTEFEVAYLSVDHMTLIYAPAGTDGWSECTWWSFVNYDDAEGFLTSEKWGWYPTEVNSGACWGNAGYKAGAQETPNNINGAWWGCGPVDTDCPNTFADQLGHSPSGALTGEEYLGSYMLFNEDGSIAKFSPDGTKLGEGTWSVDMKEDAETFSVGKLKTSAGAILWPWMINYESNNNPNKQQEPTEFNIGYLDGNNMILIYAPEGTDAWSECTWWSFGKQ